MKEESVWIIIHTSRPYKDRYFESGESARNFLKMQNPRRKFKEVEYNKFVCSRYGSTFKIIELDKTT